MGNTTIGLELHSLNNLIRRYFDFASHKKEIETVTGNNGWIIGYLADNADKEIYQRDLEAQFTITRSTASKVVRLMEQKGLVQRQSVAHDARLKKLELTEKAWLLKGLMREDGERLEETLLNGFSDEEVKLLESFIQRMKENILTLVPNLFSTSKNS
jgi:DNA-binding MarR family transcriptional regulator